MCAAGMSRGASTRFLLRCSTTARFPIAYTRVSTIRGALSVGIQHMVRSDLGSSGVMFTLDTDSGFRDVVFITASCGLGETVVQGAVNPDEFYVYKPALRKGTPPVLRTNSEPRPSRWSTATAVDGRTVSTVDVAPEDRLRFSLD